MMVPCRWSATTSPTCMSAFESRFRSTKRGRQSAGYRRSPAATLGSTGEARSVDLCKVEVVSSPEQESPCTTSTT